MTASSITLPGIVHETYFCVIYRISDTCSGNFEEGWHAASL
jgi:hypothetical protein